MALWNGFPYTYDALTYMYDAPVKYAFLTHKFTGKERDTESGLDDFDARYYSSALGRFVSADWSATRTPVPYSDFGDPQSLNLYTYVRNVPTTTVDPSGDLPPISAGSILRHSHSVRGFLRPAQREARSRTKEQVAAHMPPAFDIPANCAASLH